MSSKLNKKIHWNVSKLPRTDSEERQNLTRLTRHNAFDTMHGKYDCDKNSTQSSISSIHIQRYFIMRGVDHFYF